jgi:hypothetical protein
VGYLACIALFGLALVGGAKPEVGQALLVALIFAIFMLRDIGLVIGIHLAEGPRRPDLVVLFVAVLLYGLLPGMLALLGDFGFLAMHLFLPIAAFTHDTAIKQPNLTLALGAALPGLGAAWIFAAPKLARALRGVEGGKAREQA